jgi:hypothetical protein
MRTILFTNARDEANIEEWVIHHQLLGFDQIHIFDHKSLEPLQLRLQGFEGVTVERSEAEPVHKTNFMNQARDYARAHGFDWLMYLDADEFLHLNRDETLVDFLSDFEDMNMIGVGWCMFGTSHKETHTGLLMDNFLMSCPMIDQHIKSFARPHKICGDAINPHWFPVPEPLCDPEHSPILPKHPFNPVHLEFGMSRAYIAHYVYQSYATYIQRKINLPRDDSGTFRELCSREMIHAQFNGAPNTQLRDKYAARVLEVLKQKCPERTYYFETSS